VVTSIYAIPRLPPPQDADELLAWVLGGDIHMRPLTDEDRERIREIECIRVTAQRDIYSDPSSQQGPIIGSCAACGRPLRAQWRYCPFCGALGAPTCPRCHVQLPQEDGVNFCPGCGARTSQSAPTT